MNIYIFKDEKLENGTIVLDFFNKMKKDAKYIKNIESFLRHSFWDRDKISFEGGHIKKLKQYCYDDAEVFEFKRKFSRLLFRIFFVCDGDNVLFFGFLDKEYKPIYNKKERERVKNKYKKQIFYTKEYYKEYGQNLNKFIKVEIN